MTRQHITITRGNETLRLAVPAMYADTPRSVRVRILELVLTGRQMDAAALAEDRIRWDATAGREQFAVDPASIAQRPHAA